MIVASAPVRSVRLGNFSAAAEKRADGTILVRSTLPLPTYPRSIVDALEDWATRTPDAVLIADRDGGDWRKYSYRDVLSAIPPLAQALLNSGLSTERPLVIVSGNEIEHFLLGMAAIWVGIPYAPISPAYSLISTDYGKLGHIAELLTPGLVYASDGTLFSAALAAAMPDIPLIVRRNPPPGRTSRLFSELLETSVTPAVAEAHAAITPDTVAKILFTSPTVAEANTPSASEPMMPPTMWMPTTSRASSYLNLNFQLIA